MKDKKKQIETEEEVSLDDMMATSVPATDEKAVKTVADELQDSSDAPKAASAESSVEPKEETEVPTDAQAMEDKETETPNEVSDKPTETVTDMIEESANEAKDEVKLVDDKAIADTEETASVASPAPKKTVYRGKWYIVHTYSGHENKVAKTLMQRVQAMGFEERIFDALVPTRDTIRVRGGKKETIKEKIFPGYILVNMDLSDEAWVLVRTTPGVTSFVGAQNKPTAIRDDEVQAIVAFVEQKDPIYRAQFSVGEAVKITDGPFSDFLGTVESIDDAKGKVKVLVSIFGRETPVELDFLQVAKI